MKTALIIGAGPAGLMAADVLAESGLRVTIADAMPSVGRKFLMAGKSGLNLTKNEPERDFLAAYGKIAAPLTAALTAFGPAQVMDWTTGLGQQIFTGTTGRVFPKAMKASPLLRAWMARLNGMGVQLQTRWRWTGWDGTAVVFDTPDGSLHQTPDVTVLALGGASWARLGSNGAWATQFAKIAPFQPANCGFFVNWTPHMARFFGTPVKATALMSGNITSRGEWVITARGIEGGGVYGISSALRDGMPLTVDLMPDIAHTTLVQRIAARRAKVSQSQFLKSTLRLSPEKIALLNEFAREIPTDSPEALATVIKALPVTVVGPLPMDSAISTAGGLRFADLDDDFMLRGRPGTFCAGEMLDWEAPTGGYLITGCLATGCWAGRAAAAFANRL